MSLRPPRRWFQFKLSTWFVLVAILAWAMLEWPWVVETQSDLQLIVNLDSTGDDFGYAFAGPPIESRPINPRFFYPAFALAAFVGWQAAWLIVERRRNVGDA